jgi:hypothetical protein
MVEYLTSEELAARTFELCETCERQSKPEEHLCAAMRLDDPRVVRVFRYGTGFGVRALTAVRNASKAGYRPRSVDHLPGPTTIGELCAWSKWDLRKVDGIAHTTASVVNFVLRRAGLSLRDVSHQRARADRERAMRAASGGQE